EAEIVFDNTFDNAVIEFNFTNNKRMRRINMKFNYKEYGDILYRHESYGFRYNSGTSKIQTIDIRLTHMLDDDKFAYEIDLKDDQEFIINGKKIKRFGSADFDLYQSLGSGIQYQTLFNT